MSATHGPAAATRADAARASMRTAAVNADRAATAADRAQAAEAEMATYESYWHAHGVPAYAGRSAREGLAREHADRGLAQISAGHQAQAGPGGPEAGE
jgi:hypothetical protein